MIDQEKRFDGTVEICKSYLQKDCHKELEAYAKGMAVMCEHLGLKEEVCYEKATECIRKCFMGQLGDLAKRFGLNMRSIFPD